MEIIKSRTNAFVKKVFSLHSRKERENLKLFWAEGTKAVESALSSDKFKIREVAVCDNAGGIIENLVNIAAKKNIIIKKLDAGCFKKISVLKHPEGIGAVIEKIENKFSDLPAKADAPTAILWKMQNPGNQGAVIRSAAAFGVETIILIEPCVDEYHPMCVRATSGAIFKEKIIKCTEEKIKPWLNANAENVVAITPDGKEKINSPKISERKILIIGNEPHGVDKDVKASFVTAVIPMKADVESLNTSCAASIAMYEMFGR